MSVGPRTVIAMAEQMSLNREHVTFADSSSAPGAAPAAASHSALEDPCPRCGGVTVRVIVYGPLDFEVDAVEADERVGAFDDAPIFDCSECGFEWGLAVRDLLA